ncbi:MAG: BON domain-containing protein [Proteobacteria bacterium]|nr:BON domain-containing protein [Pseudomonadota bacterium]
MKKKLNRLKLIATVVPLFLISHHLFASETDDRIESSAKQSYVFKTFLKGDDINIQSRDGVVTLTGTVAEESNRSMVGETVANLPGVKSMNNKLIITDEGPAVYTDQWLIAKVKLTLLLHRNVNATATKVAAKNGTVTLRGEAISTAQKDLTTEYVKDVEGVTTVNNKMTILTAAIKPDEKTMGKTTDAMNEPIDDASVTALVKTTLLYHRSTSALALKTTVKTKEGVVTLSGKAKSGAEKDLATKIVSDVHGVKSVNNEMTIKGTKAN